MLDPEEADRRVGEKLTREEKEAAGKTFLALHDHGDGTAPRACPGWVG